MKTQVPANGPPSHLTVVKIGGSLLTDKEGLQRAASALAERRRDGGPLLVVASALQGVTDLLEQASAQALDRRPRNGALGETLDSLRRRHLDMLDRSSDLDRVRSGLDEVEALVGSIRAAGEMSDTDYARLLSCGERLSVLLLSAAIRAAGQEAQPVTAEEAGLRAAGPSRAGSCDLPASAPGLRRMRRHLEDQVLVLTGFYGVGGDGRDGDIVLFGRGGSDDTACAVAAGLDAGRLELWKDVPGFMSADPREVRGARVVREISFDEVAQMGAYGSRVVHHGCLEPLRGRSTQVFISSIPKNGATFGTRLVERRRRRAAQVVALASRRGAKSSPALIGVVGEGIAGHPGIRSRMLSCLAAAGIRGDLAVQPSGSSGLSCTLHPDDLTPALSGLHESFFAAEVSP
ncbi:MAG TPA: aspartate kinase [Thermoanaerobaculia bacterium]|nr:aspartate kinase [Thermoanaerobaculia bacterium]